MTKYTSLFLLGSTLTLAACHDTGWMDGSSHVRAESEPGYSTLDASPSTQKTATKRVKSSTSMTRHSAPMTANATTSAQPPSENMPAMNTGSVNTASPATPVMPAAATPAPAATTPAPAPAMPKTATEAAVPNVAPSLGE